MQIDRRLFAYEMIHLRQLDQDAMLWQVPVLALTAQAFLFTIALADTTSAFGRCFSATLAVAIAAMCMQLMAKHRFLAMLDLRGLEMLEKELGLTPIARRGWGETGVRRSFARKQSSYVVWQVGLGLFALAGVIIFGISLLRVEWLT